MTGRTGPQPRSATTDAGAPQVPRSARQALFYRLFRDSGWSDSQRILRRFHGGFPLFGARLRRFETALPGRPYLRCRAEQGQDMRVAVIGTGIAGNAAAWTLSKRYPVTVYDREARPGGHSHTVSIDYDGTPISVDTGFIVYNELNYPGLTALFDHLGVETVESCMSFAVTADGGRFEWKGGGANWIETAIGLFAQPRNLLRPSYL